MTIEETRQIIIPYFEANQDFEHHKKGCMLKLNINKYRIMPDDAFYYPNKVLLFEYENTDRPVESISKYFWLLKGTTWLNEKVKIRLLLTINTAGINEIRIQSIPILGNLLNQLFPNNFDFHFLNYSQLTEKNLLVELEKMTTAN